MKDENKINVIDVLQNLNEHFEIWDISHGELKSIRIDGIVFTCGNGKAVKQYDEKSRTCKKCGATYPLTNDYFRTTKGYFENVCVSCRKRHDARYRKSKQLGKKYPKNNLGVNIGNVNDRVIYSNPYDDIEKLLKDGNKHFKTEIVEILRKYCPETKENSLVSLSNIYLLHLKSKNKYYQSEKYNGNIKKYWINNKTVSYRKKPKSDNYFSDGRFPKFSSGVKDSKTWEGA